MDHLLTRKVASRFKNSSKDIFWEIYGKGIISNKLAKPPRSVLFICKGNICRSPFAERMAKKIFKNSLNHKIFTDSAGLNVKIQSPSPQEACEAAARFGIMLEDHLSKKIQPEMYSEFDMIVAMEASQYRALIKNCPISKGNIFLLPFFENRKMKLRGYERYNIPDPYGSSLDVYNKSFKRIEGCIDCMSKLINSL